ncbi:hypothetical protein [Acinetobacter sp. MD2]|nr:hypothetical protein [Acinetobacter sp. MD2]
MNTFVNSSHFKQSLKPVLQSLKRIIGWSIFYAGTFILLQDLFHG